MGRSLRSEIFSASEICIRHCVQRCVRKAWLAGVDKTTGKDYSYRKEWIRKRLRSPDGKHVIVERSELHSILSGIELATVKKRLRYVAPVVPNVSVHHGRS